MPTTYIQQWFFQRTKCTVSASDMACFRAWYAQYRTMIRTISEAETGIIGTSYGLPLTTVQGIWKDCISRNRLLYNGFNIPLHLFSEFILSKKSQEKLQSPPLGFSFRKPESGAIINTRKPYIPDGDVQAVAPTLISIYVMPARSVPTQTVRTVCRLQ